MLRKVIFWSHLIVGLVVGLFVFVLCLTGAILAFELQIVDYAERTPLARPPAENAAWLAPEVLIANARQVEKERIVNLQWFSDPDMPVRVFSDKRTVTIMNGYTGEVLGRGAVNLRGFMDWTTRLHTSLTAGEGGAGSWVVSVANCGFVFLILSGLWIWMPRQWKWSALRNSIILRFDLKGKTRDWNWHNATGFWFLLPLLFIALTGVVLSFRSADQWWRSFGGTSVLSASQAPTKLNLISAGSGGQWPQWMSLLQQHYPGWRSIQVGSEGKPDKDGMITFTVNYGTQRNTPFAMKAKLDTKVGAIIEERGWSSGDGSSRARSVARLGHSGEFFGIWGQLVAFLASLAGMLLVYTGFALSYRRFFASGKSRTEPTSLSKEAVS